MTMMTTTAAQFAIAAPALHISAINGVTTAANALDAGQ